MYRREHVVLCLPWQDSELFQMRSYPLIYPTSKRKHLQTVSRYSTLLIMKKPAFWQAASDFTIKYYNFTIINKPLFNQCKIIKLSPAHKPSKSSNQQSVSQVTVNSFIITTTCLSKITYHSVFVLQFNRSFYRSCNFCQQFYQIKSTLLRGLCNLYA